MVEKIEDITYISYPDISRLRVKINQGEVNEKELLEALAILKNENIPITSDVIQRLVLEVLVTPKSEQWMEPSLSLSDLSPRELAAQLEEKIKYGCFSEPVLYYLLSLVDPSSNRDLLERKPPQSNELLLAEGLVIKRGLVETDILIQGEKVELTRQQKVLLSYLYDNYPLVARYENLIEWLKSVRPFASYKRPKANRFGRDTARMRVVLNVVRKKLDASLMAMGMEPIASEVIQTVGQRGIILVSTVEENENHFNSEEIALINGEPLSINYNFSRLEYAGCSMKLSGQELLFMQLVFSEGIVDMAEIVEKLDVAMMWSASVVSNQVRKKVACLLAEAKGTEYEDIRQKMTGFIKLDGGGSFIINKNFNV
ncbi:MAG TPA: hypothetical protein VF209_03240 [Patescibacteria group bacterium]